MSELTRLLPPPPRPGPGLDPLGDPFTDAAGAAASNGHVTVSAGLYYDRLSVAGQSVSEVRRQLAGSMDIGPSASAVIDGEIVRDEGSTYVRAGQVLAFVRLAGEKGR